MDDSGANENYHFLDITLKFKKNLEDICLKESIEKVFENERICPLQIVFLESCCYPDRDETECRFTFSGDMDSAKNSLDALINSLKETFKIAISSECEIKRSFNPRPQANDVDKKKQEKLKAEIQAALKGIVIRRNEAVDEHQQKINETQSRIDYINLKDNEYEILSDKDIQNREVLSLKLLELELQEKEFLKRCKQLHSDLHALDISKTSSDVSFILKCVSIECSRLKGALPIYAKRADIVKEVDSKQVSIILGETGSGKSTQMAQYLLEAGFAKNGSIICTQPRKIAALTLAERIANEMIETVGGLVGYKAGIHGSFGENTKLFLTTDHSLLNECLRDPELRKYSCIIVDEAHERSIYTDILLGMIKLCLKKRPELKVIITSATIDPGIFIKYFNCGPELRVSGRTFPVDLFYTEDLSDDFEKYEEKAVNKAVEIHNSQEDGDILVFLSSPVEIMRCCEGFQHQCKQRSDFKCFPLHGQLPKEEQREVFKALPRNERKIVFATNCAETSITIDGIKHVIDTGVAKEMKYDPKRNMNKLGVHPISKSSADQRKGRAGRTASGKCYRLYSKGSFEAMENISEPEILRVHLGQAVLKLSELGVSIQSYDFVQAPNETALKAAVDTLEYLGAIANNQITQLGRWISKMPFDPKLGYIVFKSHEKNILFDAIVLAAVVSIGSDLFYHGFTEKESQTVARSKLGFGSDLGDIFTWVKVYQAWREQKKEKASWCRSRGVNNKCVSLAHQCIKDVKEILSKDFNIDLAQEFSAQPETVNELRELLLVAYADSISNFSSIKRAGYYSLATEHQVHVHPSSVIKAMDLTPEWVVYTSLVKTSQDFIKGITVVEEKWINDLIEAGKLCIDLKKAKLNKFNLIHREEVGPSVFRGLVGPCFSNLHNLEEEVSNTGLKRFSLELRRDLGTLDIYSPNPINQSQSLQIFSDLKSQVMEELMIEDEEFHLNKDKAIGPSGIRVVIGKGGCVKNIFMPYQSDKVIVKGIPPDVSEDDIKRKFGAFGEIKEMISFKCRDPWGFIRYGSAAEALAAVQATAKDEKYAGKLKLDAKARNMLNTFEVKLSWIRRRIKGRGTAFISDFSPLDITSLFNHNIFLPSGRLAPIKLSKKKENNLVVFDTGSASEVQIRDEVMRLLGPRRDNNKDLKVFIPREPVSFSRDEDERVLRDFEFQIKRFIEREGLREDGLDIHILKPQPKNIWYVSFVKFTDPMRGFEICQEMEKKLVLNGTSVEVRPFLKTVVHVPQKIREACKERFSELFAGLAEHKAIEVSWKKLKKDHAIEIKSSTPKDIVMARDLISKEIEGEIIDCSINDVVKCLLNKPGQEFLQRIEKENKCLLMTDFRCSKIHLFGSDINVNKTKIDINSYLSDVEGSEQRLFYFRGADKPPGLMKRIMQEHGPLLDDLTKRFDLKSVSVDWKKQSVHLLGPQAAVDKTIEHLLAIEKKVSEVIALTKENYMPDCMVCLCPIETASTLCRLELCGHAYCSDCLKYQISYAVNNKEFPFTCAGDGCDSLFVKKDIKFALSRKWITEDKFVSMALNAFVTQNNDKFKFCLTPNCPVVYEITTDNKGCQFTCPVCFASMCTTCHNAFHAGIPCELARGAGELMTWMDEEPTRRKICPGCHIGIEKIDGCNKMSCQTCKTVFCWKCLKICTDEQDCYAHLQREHNGFF